MSSLNRLEYFKLFFGGLFPIQNFAGVNINLQLNVITVMFSRHEFGNVTIIIGTNFFSVHQQGCVEKVTTLGRYMYCSHVSNNLPKL